MPLQLSELSDAESPDKEYLWTLNFGPQHPATHTTLRIVLTLDGEKVVDAVPHIGYLHSGFEKLGEVLDFNQYVTIVDRMNYILAGRQRERGAPRRREADRSDDHPAVHPRPHDLRGANADSRPSA